MIIGDELFCARANHPGKDRHLSDEAKVLPNGVLKLTYEQA